MKTSLFKIFAIITACIIFSGAAFADVKIKTRQTMNGQSYEGTVYIKGKRQRSEQNMGEMQMVNLTQCDLKRGVQLNPLAQVYMINSWADDTSTPSTVKTSGNVQTEIKKGGVITSIITTKDTGETKKMFGYLARHLIVTSEMKSSPDACTQINSKMQTDGWYIDAAFQLDCDYQTMGGYGGARNSGGCHDKYEYKQVGATKRGYPVYEKTTMFDESGKETYTMTTEVVELSNATLDQSLFEIPSDYREVKDASAMYTAGMKNLGQNSESSSYGTTGASQNSALGANVGSKAAQKSDNISTEVGAKKEGYVRIGIPAVKVGAVGEGLNASDLAAAIQNSLGNDLKGTKIELVAIEARLPSQADLEAKQKDCDYVLYASATHKKGGGGFGGMLGKTIGQAVMQTGGGAWGNTAANVAGGVAVNAIGAATVSQNVKAKDEITLDIKLQQPGGAATLAKQFKAKANSNGDDIISQVVEQAAAAITSAAVK